MRLKPIHQQVVVVMGASSGIGRHTAYRFARHGAQVVVAARSQEGLDSLVAEIEAFGGSAIAVAADVTDFEQVQRVAETAVNSYGRIDTWVHMAAVSLYATFEETTLEEFRRIFDVNLLGQIHGAKAALPHLRQTGGGALIHVSSVEALRTLPYQAAYGASKHGIVGFLDALRLELQHEGVPISVTNVMPASINTPLFNKARTKLGVMPMGVPPIYEPQVVTNAILHAAEHPTRDIFAGDAARMIAFTQALSPRLMDLFLLSTGFSGQRTNQPKPESAPDNFEAPIDGYNRVHGDFGDQALAVSPYNELVQMSGMKTALAGLAIGVFLKILQRARPKEVGYDDRYDRRYDYRYEYR